MAAKVPRAEKVEAGADAIANYAQTQTPEHAAICRALRAEIEAALPKAASKIWHGSPVWFIGENPVAGYNVTAKKGVNLLFWNGQSFAEPALKAAGKFKAAEIQFNDVSEIDAKSLRRWLKKAKTDIWDSRAHFLTQKALQENEPVISPPVTADLAAKRDALLASLAELPSCGVAYSGGVDSAVLAKAAQLSLGERAVAVTGSSASLAGSELEDAKRLAATIGIRHVILATDEFANPAYLQNAPDRCYHCKTELYTQMKGWAEKLGVQVLVNGANLDDRGDYRPGMTAAAEHAVRSPLLESGFTKADVRALAAHWQLPVWDKPASPCLSSRVAYGEAVTPERLAMIDAGEQFLRSLGLREVRVRYHKGDLARLEVPSSELQRLSQPETAAALARRFRELGFKFVTLDLEGFRSGSLNQLVQLGSPVTPITA